MLMADSHDIHALTSELETLLAAKLGLRHGDMMHRIDKAGRRLPKWLHRDGRLIGDAVALGAHPKLARQIDYRAVRAAHHRIRDHLKTIDPADRRRGALLGLLGSLSFNLLVMVGLVIALLKWRGYI